MATKTDKEKFYTVEDDTIIFDTSKGKISLLLDIPIAPFNAARKTAEDDLDTFFILLDELADEKNKARVNKLRTVEFSKVIGAFFLEFEKLVAQNSPDILGE